MATYEKIGDSILKEMNPSPIEVIHTVESLKRRLELFQSQLASLRDENMIAAREAVIRNNITKIQALIDKCTELGVQENLQASLK